MAKEGLDAAPVTCPIGIGAIRSTEPASIAVAVAVAVAADLLLRLERLGGMAV